jgi:guanidinoacetate N-methyltransferase
MQRWEDSYMAQLASVVTKNGGTILEIGFGMGISSNYIQAADIDKHIVIEAHPTVTQHALSLMHKEIKLSKFTIIQGFWETTTKLLADQVFDGILLDTCPLTQETLYYHDHHFFAEAYRLLKTGGLFTYFSDEATQLSQEHSNALREIGFSQVSSYAIDVQPSKNCRYWHESRLVVPVIVK